MIHVWVKSTTRRAYMGVMLAISVALVLACAARHPTPYLQARAAAQRAYSAGRYEEAAQHYRQAADAAERKKNRDEMLYREAASYHRGKQHDQAKRAYEELLARSPDGARAARADYELIQIEIDRGDEQRGYQMLPAFVRKHARSGLGRRAMQRYLLYVDREQGPEASLAYLREQQAFLEANALGEAASYETARRLEDTGKLEQARDQYVSTAERYPYPKGGLFDDSLWRASLLEEKLGNPTQAIAHLRRMLHVREPSTMSGSYERPRFSAAQMRIAELYRDALNDPASARREFRKLFLEFETSPLRDKALWEEAKLSAKLGDQAQACAAVTLLVRELEESRYAPCAQLVCASAPRVSNDRSCRQYIARDIASEANTP